MRQLSNNGEHRIDMHHFTAVYACENVYRWTRDRLCSIRKVSSDVWSATLLNPY